MSQPSDVLDDRIREALQQTSVGSADLGSVRSSVQAAARARRNRRRAGAAIGSAAACGLLAFVLADQPEDARVETEAPAASDTTTAADEYGFAPYTPLVDGPLPLVPLTELAKIDRYILAVTSEPGKLGLRLSDGLSSGGSSSDPEATPAITFSGQSPSEQEPEGKHLITGITRSEVTRIDWVRSSGTVSVATIAHPALPQLRFFIIEDTLRTLGPPEPGQLLERPLLVAYGVDGTLLTDSDRIHAEESSFFEEVDRRRGVEDKVAAVREVRVGADGQSLILTVFNCGQEAFPTFAEGDASISISATVKRSYSDGDCLSGETVELHIGLNEPLAERTLIDDRTGQPLPLG